ncbi:MAG: carboxymuconolactone decarboxylase family protein [Pseudomonadota bacterium]|nr:carboxymuconolactone decarboxylase family protein [Pseudomonadota bacterium]
MQRIPPVDTHQPSELAAPMLAAVKSKMGMIPNLMATLANAPVALQSYLDFSGTLQQGALPARLREQLALAVANRNGCQYCASAHAMLGKQAGLSTEDIRNGLGGEAKDTQENAALRFALAVVEQRGQVSDRDLDGIRNAGFDDGEIVEIIAHVVLNTFTNYLNNVANTDIDFPVVSLANA